MVYTNKQAQNNSALQIPPISPSMLKILKDQIVYTEFLLLEEIGFNVEVLLPYKHISKHVDSLCFPLQAKNNFLRLAYRFANDFYRTSAPLVKSHYNISEACVFLASNALKLETGIIPDPETLSILKFAIKLECTP